MFQSFPIFGIVKKIVMNTNCLPRQESFDSPLLNERTKGLGRNFFYTVLVFVALCALSYVLHGY
jgi:hypothetical protein